MRTKLIILLVVALMVGGMVSTQDSLEPPILAERVAAGDLPPLAERLPVDPQITQPLVESGEYGGELRVGFIGADPFWGGMVYVNGWEMPIAWKPDFSGVEPNIFSGWEISEDVTEYTFFLREGMKWSDGVPYTADDIMFYIDDVLFNTDLNPGGPSIDWLPRDGAEDLVVEKLNDYAVKFTFAQPYGTFLLSLAQWPGRIFGAYPKHFMTQFHADYNENVDDLVAAEDGVEDWVGLFNKYGDVAAYMRDTQNSDMLDVPAKPTLNPWIVTQELGTGTTVRFERNPYYWKVDDSGRQLPYIDSIVAVQYQDGETRTFAMLNGDLDYIIGPGGDNRVTYFDAVDEGRPIAIAYPQAGAGNTASIMFNQTVDDPVLAPVFADKNFRIGMSYAINRPELIEILNAGQGEPAQVSPLEDSPLYIEQLAKQYTEYDVDLANEYLDRVLPEKDEEGYRLGSDGERFSFVIFVQGDNPDSGYAQLGELLIGYWREVGIEALLNVMGDDPFGVHKADNTIEAHIYTGTGGAGLNAMLDARYYVPGSFWGTFGNGWYYWRTDDSSGVQVPMPDEMLAIREAYEDVLRQPSQDEQIAAMREVLQMSADHFFVLGISRPAPDYHPYNARLVNIPPTWTNGWIVGIAKIQRPEQWFIKE